MKSSDLGITSRREKFVEVWSAVLGELQRVYAEEVEANGMTKAKIAEILGKNKSVITRQLAGNNPLNIETIADLLFAWGKDINFQIVDPKDANGANGGSVRPASKSAVNVNIHNRASSTNATYRVNL